MHKKSDGTYVQTVNYTYNIRNQLTDINNTAALGNDYFADHVLYDGLHNGSIKSVSWKTSKNTALKTYPYTYDA